jgi:hypothetical protein
MLGSRFLPASTISVSGIPLDMKPGKTVEHFELAFRDAHCRCPRAHRAGAAMSEAKFAEVGLDFRYHF